MANETSWRPNPKMGPAVARIRVEQGLSQAELGRNMGGVTQQFVSKVERGLVPVTPKCATRLARGLGVPIQRVYAEARKNLRSQPKGCTTKDAPS
jgi:transcriptional regulator with XRE-family HTH domain